MTYHNRFNNLHDGAVQHVDDAAPALWNRDDWTGHRAVLQELAEGLADVYGVDPPAVEHGRRETYASATSTIALPRPSLVSFLHEFRHHMQANGMQAIGDVEEDARAWSISLFAEAEPEYFDDAWRNGTIWFMPEHPEGGR